MENIDKMLNCGDPSFGGAMYVCTTAKAASALLAV